MFNLDLRKSGDALKQDVGAYVQKEDFVGPPTLLDVISTRKQSAEFIHQREASASRQKHNIELKKFEMKKQSMDGSMLANQTIEVVANQDLPSSEYMESIKNTIYKPKLKEGVSQTSTLQKDRSQITS